jgi:hypothetical protein
VLKCTFHCEKLTMVLLKEWFGSTKQHSTGLPACQVLIALFADGGVDDIDGAESLVEGNVRGNETLLPMGVSSGGRHGVWHPNKDEKGW